eukprot:gene3127-13139_t
MEQSQNLAVPPEAAKATDAGADWNVRLLQISMGELATKSLTISQQEGSLKGKLDLFLEYTSKYTGPTRSEERTISPHEICDVCSDPGLKDRKTSTQARDSTCAGHAKSLGGSSANLQVRMLGLGHWLLEHSILCGFASIADIILTRLMHFFNLSFSRLASSATQSKRSLLHLAVQSGKAYMVAVVVNWGESNVYPLSWFAEDPLGVTPLHMAAMHKKADLVESVLKHFPAARIAWVSCQGLLSSTPAEIAQHLDMHIDNELARCGKKRDTPDRTLQKRCAAPRRSPLSSTSYARKGRSASDLDIPVFLLDTSESLSINSVCSPVGSAFNSLFSSGPSDASAPGPTSE